MEKSEVKSEEGKSTHKSKRPRIDYSPEALPILASLEKDPNCYFFLDPVDPDALGIPIYFDIIKNPMDFSTIKKKLSECEYDSFKDFAADLFLVF